MIVNVKEMKYLRTALRHIRQIFCNHTYIYVTKLPEPGSNMKSRTYRRCVKCGYGPEDLINKRLKYIVKDKLP